MLYGKSSSGNPWLALRAGKTVDEQVILPASTQKVIACAMYQTHSKSGSYTINWDDLWLMVAVDDYAFYDSGLSGEVHYGLSGYYSYLMEHAFEKCSGITSVTIHGTIESIGEGCFFDCSGGNHTDILWKNRTTYIGLILLSVILLYFSANSFFLLWLVGLFYWQ